MNPSNTTFLTSARLLASLLLTTLLHATGSGFFNKLLDPLVLRAGEKRQRKLVQTPGL